MDRQEGEESKAYQKDSSDFKTKFERQYGIWKDMVDILYEGL